MVSAGQKPYISVKLQADQSPVDAIREALSILGGEDEKNDKGSEE
jgi:transcription-repair coupling factor (superfamily II helicase)